MSETSEITQEDFAMAQYITNVLFAQRYVIYSWGYQQPRIIKNGLVFYVNGFKHKGDVEVMYNQRYDLFDLQFLNKGGKIVHSVNMVYVDQLVDVIDDYVERVDNYEQAVRDEYSKPCPLTDN